MKICLVGYIDNTPENKQMLDTYELRNDFWAEKFAFRRRDGKQVTDEELREVSKWIDREIVKKHRTNWLSNRETPYIDVKDPELIKKYCPWMSDQEIQEQLEAERRSEELAAIRDLPYEEMAAAVWPDDNGMQLIAREQARRAVEKYRQKEE